MGDERLKKTWLPIVLFLLLVSSVSAIVIVGGAGSGNSVIVPTNGSNGVNGSQGIQGVPGVNGTNGINGTNGNNGADGAQGIPGVNGTNEYLDVTKLINASVLAYTNITGVPVTIDWLNVTNKATTWNWLNITNKATTWDWVNITNKATTWHWDNITGKQITNDTNCNATGTCPSVVYVNDANKTFVSCKNITGSASDLCILIGASEYNITVYSNQSNYFTAKNWFYNTTYLNETRTVILNTTDLNVNGGRVASLDNKIISSWKNISDSPNSTDQTYVDTNFAKLGISNTWTGLWQTFVNAISTMLNATSIYSVGINTTSINWTTARGDASNLTNINGSQINFGNISSRFITDISNMTKIPCQNITGGSDSDYCTDAQGAGAGNDYSPIWIPMWLSTATAPVAGQGLNLPIALTEIASVGSANNNGSRITLNITEMGNMVQLRWCIYTASQIVGLDGNRTINVSIRQDGNPSNLLIEGSINLSRIGGRGGNTTLQCNTTQWQNVSVWAQQNGGNATLAAFTGQAGASSATGDYIFTKINAVFKNRTVTN